MKVLAEERQQLILELLRTSQVVTLQQICAHTKCSESSARRDLQQLEANGLLARIHGGATLRHSLQDEASMSGKQTQNVAQKTAIAQYAAGLVQPHDVIFLDAGTTTLAMVPYLRGIEDVTVVTNGINHANALIAAQVKTLILGGIIKPTTKAIIGSQAVASLRHFSFNKAFLGTNGIDLRQGLTTPDTEEAELKRMAQRQAEQVFALADASKFNHVSFVSFAALKDAIIISDQITDELKHQYQSHAIIQEAIL